MIVSKFAYVLKKRRLELRLTQRALGKKVGVSGKQISKLEVGDRVPTKALYLRLQEILGKLPYPHRFKTPRHNERWRILFRDQRIYRRPKDRSLTSRVKAARLSYPVEIEKLKRVIEEHQAMLEAGDSGSGLELIVCLLVLAFVGAVELSVRPVSWGYRGLAVCDPVSGEILADKSFPAIGLEWDDCTAVLIPQVTVLTKDRPITLDFLVCVRIGRRTVWFALEVDGPGHCSKADELRASFLKTARISEAEILAPNFISTLQTRLRAMLEMPEATAKRAA